MLWYQNPLLRAILQSSFKVSNQRIASIAKRYGTRSFTYQQYISKFEKPMYKEFVTISEAGKKVGRNISTGGNLKFDVKAINKMILSGKANRETVNQLLAEAAGIRIEKDGTVTKLTGDYQGIPTISTIRKITERKLKNMGEDPTEYSKSEIDRITEKLAEFSATFDTAYNSFIKEYGEDTALKDPIIKTMYGEYRPHKGRLTYRELESILDRFNDYKSGVIEPVNNLEKEG